MSVIFHRFSGGTWLGEYPYTGATFLLIIVTIPVALAASTPLASITRLAVPLLLVFLFLSQAHGDGNVVQRLQGRLELPHFLLVLFSTVMATLFTGPKESIEPIEEKTESEVPASAARPPEIRSFDRIIGQEHVIGPLKEIAKIARTGIRVGKRNAPHAVLLSLGPTGVGKTEAARALAEAVFDSTDSLIRFDMGQFTDAHQANRFYGPPPGYVGSDKGGQLTRAVLRKPRSVVLLDEVEKAHPKIWDAFLPVFDEGYIVDGSTNQKVDMTNTIIVLTSNLLSGEEGLAELRTADLKEKIQETGVFRPELLGRINEILVFNPLSKEVIAEILQRRLDAALWDLAEQGISIQVEEHEGAALVEELQAAKFGVRQIDDVVRKFLRGKITELDDNPISD